MCVNTLIKSLKGTKVRKFIYIPFLTKVKQKAVENDKIIFFLTCDCRKGGSVENNGYFQNERRIVS